MEEFKTPSRAMAAAITLVLLALFAFSYLAPVLDVPWLRADAKFSEALQQTLLTLLVLSVGYFIGSSKGSADNGDALRKQLDKSTPTVSPLLATLPAAKPQVVKVDDSTPIHVTDVKPVEKP